MAVFDFGSGPSLYVAGSLRTHGPEIVLVARWDGMNWHPIATTTGSGEVRVLRAHDDGNGPALFAGGSFTLATAGPLARGVARWNGTTWSDLGTGSSTQVDALELFDEGGGERLFLAGRMWTPSGGILWPIAQWNGAVLTGRDAGLPAGATAKRLKVYESAGIPGLYALGAQPSALGPSNPIPVAWQWVHSAWTALPDFAAIGSHPSDLAVADADFGRQLLASTHESGSLLVRRFTGTSWIQVGESVRGACGSDQLITSFLGEVDFGTGPRLCLSPGIQGATATTFGATFVLAGGSWITPGGRELGMDSTNRVRLLASFDDGSGPALYAAGNFCHVDGVAVSNIARLRNETWERASLAGQNFYPSMLTVCDVGGGPRLYASGLTFTSPNNWISGLMRWTGDTWQVLGTFTNGAASAYAAVAANLDGVSRLYVGGSFQFAGSFASPNFAAFSGPASSPWSALPPGPTAGVNGDVRALATFDSGAGVGVILGGGFTAQTSGIPLAHIARWNGTSFSALGSGMNGDVWALRTFDDGSGIKLYAAGAFTTAGGVPAQRIARFDGNDWSNVGAGFDALVTCLEVFDDGSGPALYAAGDFMASGTTTVPHIARWDGTAWSALGNGVGPSVHALTSHAEAPGGPARLFIGGRLDTAGTLTTSNLAAWRGCGGAIERFCFGDGTSSPCPCENSGLVGLGCNNSTFTGGARLDATGTTNPDTIELHAAGENPSATTLVFQGSSLLGSPISFGDGLRCVGGSLQRLYTTNAVNGALTVPAAGQPSISARSAQLGDPLSPGSVRGYQTWYRDVSASYCSAPMGNTWNLSNAVRIAW